MRRLFIAAIIAFGFASPALASHCPKDVKLIDAALTQQSNAEAQTLRDKGDALHRTGPASSGVVFAGDVRRGGILSLLTDPRIFCPKPKI